jgi:succinate dehydrogenase/fumarate reductase cytochrome b subunit
VVYVVQSQLLHFPNSNDDIALMQRPVTRTQRYSSYAFTVFTAFHITNVSIIPLLTRSVSESNRYLLLTRPYYQSIVTEPLLVALPLVAHVASGIALRLYRRRQALKRYGAETKNDRRTIPWPALSGTSALGYALVPLASFHVWTTRILPLYAHGDSSLINLSYISHGFATHPFISFTGFTALISVGAWHVVWGAAKWMGFAPSQVSSNESQKAMVRKRRWYSINAVSALVAALWLAGGLGVVGRDGKVIGWVGKEYDELYRYIPFLGTN